MSEEQLKEQIAALEKSLVAATDILLEFDRIMTSGDMFMTEKYMEFKQLHQADVVEFLNEAVPVVDDAPIVVHEDQMAFDWDVDDEDTEEIIIFHAEKTAPVSAVVDVEILDEKSEVTAEDYAKLGPQPAPENPMIWNRPSNPHRAISEFFEEAKRRDEAGKRGQEE